MRQPTMTSYDSEDSTARRAHGSDQVPWMPGALHRIVQVLRYPAIFGSVAARKMFGRECPEADEILARLAPLEETSPFASEPPVHTKLRRYLQAQEERD